MAQYEMMPYESRLRAWAMKAGYKNYMTASLKRCRRELSKRGYLAEFIEAFPFYREPPDDDAARRSMFDPTVR